MASDECEIDEATPGWCDAHQCHTWTCILGLTNRLAAALARAEKAEAKLAARLYERHSGTMTLDWPRKPLTNLRASFLEHHRSLIRRDRFEQVQDPADKPGHELGAGHSFFPSSGSERNSSMITATSLAAVS